MSYEQETRLIASVRLKVTLRKAEEEKELNREQD